MKKPWATFGELYCPKVAIVIWNGDLIGKRDPRNGAQVAFSRVQHDCRFTYLAESRLINLADSLRLDDPREVYVLKPVIRLGRTLALWLGNRHYSNFHGIS